MSFEKCFSQWRLWRVVAILGLGVGLAACEKLKTKAGEYDLPVNVVYQKLSQDKLSDFMFRRQCGILIHLRTTGEENRSITWSIDSAEVEMLWIKARLVALTPQRTKVEIEVGPTEWNGREAYDGDQFYRRPAVYQPVRPAILEQIDAILRNRPFNIDAAVGKDSPHDGVCGVQRAGLESGSFVFSITDAETHGVVRAVPPIENTQECSSPCSSNGSSLFRFILEKWLDIYR